MDTILRERKKMATDELPSSCWSGQDPLHASKAENFPSGEQHDVRSLNFKVIAIGKNPCP